MSRHNSLINRAIGVALTSEQRWRHGALLVQGNRILEASANKFRCSPNTDHMAASHHAEEMVLRRRLLSCHRVA